MRRLIFILLFCLAFPVSTVQAADIPAQSFTLPNGLELVVLPNHRVPAVSHLLLYRAGGADDPQTKSGLAHYLEHMMFRGTRNHAPGDYAKIVSQHGGQENAFTTHDYTGFYANIAKEHLPLVMELEADRMANLSPPPEKFPTELQVILEERKMRTENIPLQMLSERMNNMLYMNHPYRLPVIGWRQEMGSFKPEDVIEFWKRWYHPSNAVLIVAGDVEPQEVRTLAEKYYGPIPAGETPPRPVFEEPVHNGSVRLEMAHVNAAQPVWVRRYLAPNFAGSPRSGAECRAAPCAMHPEKGMALSLAEQLLGGGSTSRLYRSLVVRQKLATSVSAGYDGMVRGPGTFDISAVPAPGISAGALEKAVDAEIAAFLSQPVSAGDLERAKTLTEASLVYTQDGLEEVASVIGRLRMLNLPAQLFNEWPARIEAVTGEQVQTALREIIIPSQSVTALLHPPEATPKAGKP